MRDNFLNLQKSHAMSTRAMVATSHSLASASAHSAFLRGGNAMDAALTAVIVQGVVDPAMTGIGGDCFCLVGDPLGKVHAFNGSGRSPAAARFADLGPGQIVKTDPAALTIPGAPDAWSQLHARFGKLPWADLFTDAISFAQNGYPVLERVAADWAEKEEFLATSDSASPIYLNRDAKAPRAGEIWSLPQLAQTLQTIACDGAEAFYQGQIGNQLLATCQVLGGAHQASDFKDHCGSWVAPISTPYAGRQVFECPPNGQGLVALIAFAILERARVIGTLTSTGVFDPDRVEWQLRALSAGYEVRDRFIADPSACPSLEDAYLDPSFVAQLTEEVLEQKLKGVRLYAAPFSTPHRDTVYVAARDESGLSVSLINSIFNAFGSGHVAGDTGVLLHSRGMSFSTDPNHPNAFGPSKLPMHTIIPSMAKMGDEIETIFAVMGAHYQPQGQVHVFTAMHDCGLSPQGAQDLPRWFANPEGFVEVEATVPDSLVRELERRLGPCKIAQEPMGGSQIIHMHGKVMIGGSDPRKDGIALGY